MKRSLPVAPPNAASTALTLALGLGFLPSALAAEALRDREAALKLPDMLISADRQAEARSDSSSASTVFTRDDIERLQASSVTDLLARVPGVQVSQSGGRGSLPGIYIRGTRSAQSLVLVDGQRIANATSGDSALQFLDIEQVERVEVLRGPRSALYGADAMGGVIQIFTRRGDSQALQARLRTALGNRGVARHNLGMSAGDDQTRINLGAGLDETGGIDRTGPSFDSDGDRDAYRNESLSLSASHQFAPELEIGVSALDDRGTSEFDNPFGRFDPGTLTSVGQQPYSRFEVNSVSTWINAHLSAGWTSRLEAGHSENRETSRDKLSTERSAFNTYRDTLTWQNDLALNDRHSVILGGDWYEDRVAASTDFDRDSRWNRAWFAQHRYRAEAFSTELGVRQDHNQQFGGHDTWSASLTLPVDPRNDLVLSWSQGFRAPTFNDLYYPGFSNPDLKPERSTSYELQWRSHLTDSTQVEASLYRTDLRDAIALDAEFRPRNIGKARIDGFEASLRQHAFGWTGTLALAFIDPRDRDTGHTLNRRARRTLSLDLDRDIGRFAVGGSWQAVSSSYNDEANAQPVGGYALLGLRGSWRVSDELKLELKLDNALDRRYSRTLYSFDGNYYGYREEGRSWLIALTWTPTL